MEVKDARGKHFEALEDRVVLGVRYREYVVVVTVERCALTDLKQLTVHVLVFVVEEAVRLSVPGRGAEHDAGVSWLTRGGAAKGLVRRQGSGYACRQKPGARSQDGLSIPQLDCS